MRLELEIVLSADAERVEAVRLQTQHGAPAWQQIERWKRLVPEPRSLVVVWAGVAGYAWICTPQFFAHHLSDCAAAPIPRGIPIFCGHG